MFAWSCLPRRAGSGGCVRGESGREQAVGVGRGIALQLLRLSGSTPPGHVGGRREGGGAERGKKQPQPGQPQAHLQENSGWERDGNCADPCVPPTKPRPTKLARAAGRWPEGGDPQWSGERGGEVTKGRLPSGARGGIKEQSRLPPAFYSCQSCGSWLRITQQTKIRTGHRGGALSNTVCPARVSTGRSLLGEGPSSSPLRSGPLLAFLAPLL